MERALHVLLEVGIHIDLRPFVALASVVLLLIRARHTHLGKRLLVWLLKLCDTASLVVLLVLVGIRVSVSFGYLRVLVEVWLRVLTREGQVLVGTADL